MAIRKISSLSILLLGMACAMMLSCSDDDTDRYDDYNIVVDDDEQPNDSTVAVHDTLEIAIVWNGAVVALTGDIDSITFTMVGSDVSIVSATDKYLELTLSGSTTDGSLLINSLKKYGIILNGVSITNADGPAINNQCGKSLYVTLAEGTDNYLTDGDSYAEQTFDQKGTFFSEGQVFFNGTGSLTINGKSKNGIACDDYIVIDGGTITVNVEETGSNGIKVNDGFTMNDGTLNISVTADAARGIKSDARVTISGGAMTITTSGDCETEIVDGVEDASSAAGIKCDSLFTMTAGSLTITSKGDGGKGINCADTIKFEGGKLVANTTGSNDEGKPKAVKGDKGIIVSGGSFMATCKKSWALDNGVNTEDPQQRVTILGAPTINDVQKRSVIIKYE